MRGALAGLLFGVALGLGAGLVAAGLEAWLLEHSVEQGLIRIALARAAELAAWGAAAGVLAAALGLALARIARALLARRAPRGAAAIDRVATALARRVRWVAAAAALGIAAAGLAWGVGAWAPARAVAGRPNVLLVVMDTARADHFSSFGYARPTSPELDAFAAQAVLFPRFYSTSSWTLPGHASLFTGTYPEHHGATQEHWRLDRPHATLAEVLRDAGWNTWAASANPIVGRISHLDQGFAAFEDVWRGNPKLFEGGPAAHPVNRAFAAFLQRADRERPFFAFLNYMDAHRPYTPPPEYLQRMSRTRVNPLAAARVGSRQWYEVLLEGPGPPAEVTLISDLYDAEIAFLSASLGALLAELRRDGRFDQTLIVLTADHGEHLGEHGLWDHVFSLYEPVLHIPLFVRLPGGERAGTRDARLGQLVDLFPTILRICGVAAPQLPVQGADLFTAPPRAEVLASYEYPLQALAMIGAETTARYADRLRPFQRGLRALQSDGRKLISGSDGSRELYDLRSDPLESRDLAAGEEALVAEYATRLEAESARLAAGEAPHEVLLPDDKERERNEALRALGYAR